MIDVAIIGAGLAGLHCAALLGKRGFTVEIFDKSRGIGGRLATRQVNDLRLDHGLPSWEILGEHTEQLTQRLLAAKLLQPWLVTESNVVDVQLWKSLPMKTHYAARDGMTAIAKFIAQDLTVNRGHHLTAIQANAKSWQLTFHNEQTIAAKAIVLAMPYPQIQPLITAFNPQAKQLQSISYEPSLSLMLGYDSLNIEVPWQELRLGNHPIFRKIIFDGQKRSPQAKTMVLQSHEDFAQDYLDAASLKPAQEMLIESSQTLFKLPEPAWAQMHRWRYALPQAVLGQPYLALDTALPMIACGDWCLGNGIEGAIASGLAAAESLAQ
ncbi:MAG: FAD-dependent oxidoreductase [Limnothrix sp.]